MNTDQRLTNLENEMKLIKRRMSSILRNQKDDSSSSSSPPVLTDYQKYLQRSIPELKEKYPQLHNRERFKIATRQWKEYKNGSSQ